MKREKEKIDALIKETLTKEEATFYDQLEEQNIFEKLGAVYKGKMGWLAVIMNMVQLVLFGIFIFCTIKFFNTDDTNTLIKWASGGFLCMMVMAMLKLYIWMQMDKNDTLRELKRLELQLAAILGKMDK
ncbi:MAG: hypothetical protein MUO53_00250 [Maribacter sp.]|nr:hypothetical protein [Maribacter sp.]